MFVDGDDFLSNDACEVAYNAIESNKTDIVQFDVNIINCVGVPESRIESNYRSMKPYLEKISADNLIYACWKENLFGFNLWNKIYNGNLCRKAFSYIKDGYYPKAQDLYAFFIIAFWANSSSGIENCLYNYNFGIGITGGRYLTFDKFKVLLTERNIYEALIEFLATQNAVEKYSNVLQSIYSHFLSECVNKWFNVLTPELSSDGFKELTNTWGSKEVLCKLASKYWFERSRIAEKMLDVDYFNYIKRPTNKRLTIAAYYRSISNGGAQRVVATLCNIWANLKDNSGTPLYHIILITDEQVSDDEYYLNENIQRAFLPDFENSVKDNYIVRFEAWEEILAKYEIDVVVSSMWVAPCTLWDMLCVKGFKTKPAFIIHSHNFCCLPYKFAGNTGLELTYSYQLCDGVVTLSECDRQFASTFSLHTKCIVNPLTFQSKPDKSVTTIREQNTLIWVGRISAEKQPLDAIYMMQYLVSEMPNVKLYIVGDGDEGLFRTMETLIECSGLGQNIILTGFTQDVAKYYERANIYIGTSEYEGFSLTFCEAMSYALPIVSYDMPWLTFMQDGRGIIAVKQHRVDLLAKEVLNLLHNPELCLRLGSEGQQQVIEMEKIDIANEWKTFFGNIGNQIQFNSFNLRLNEQIIYKYISIYQQQAKNNIRNTLQKKLDIAYKQKSELNKKLQITYDEKFERGLQIKELKKQNDELKNSTTFKVGKIIMYFPIKCKNCLKGIRNILFMK